MAQAGGSTARSTKEGDGVGALENENKGTTVRKHMTERVAWREGEIEQGEPRE
jgi:hypothetical protein